MSRCLRRTATAVLAAAKQSINEIDPQWRRSILSDQALLKELHVIAQLDPSGDLIGQGSSFLE